VVFLSPSRQMWRSSSYKATKTSLQITTALQFDVVQADLITPSLTRKQINRNQDQLIPRCHAYLGLKIVLVPGGKLIVSTISLGYNFICSFVSSESKDGGGG
jgi:hypothetical protein